MTEQKCQYRTSGENKIFECIAPGFTEYKGQYYCHFHLRKRKIEGEQK